MKKQQRGFTINSVQTYNVTYEQAEYYDSQLEILIIMVLKKNKFLYKKQDNKLIILGKVANGSKPQQGGINVGLQLLIVVTTINNDSKSGHVNQTIIEIRPQSPMQLIFLLVLKMNQVS